MAPLVAVCRNGEEDFPFLSRQIPLYVDDSLTLVMELSDGLMEADSHQINDSQLKTFAQNLSKLKQQDLNVATTVTSKEVFGALSQLVPCVGCRRSVERLFSQVVESGSPALEPLTVASTGTLSVTKACLQDVKKLYTLFYFHGLKLNDVIDAIPKSKKNKRCQLHSLDTHRPKPLDGWSWTDVWERMSQECRDEMVLVNSARLLGTLETYMCKHMFCPDCQDRVLRAYDILVGELDCSKEKDYCAALYAGLRCCLHECHVHVCCETDLIAHLLGRAEPEITGRYERGERHARTIDAAQEEVLTCLGILLYERLLKIWQRLRAEEQTWQMLFYLGTDALRKRFETAVEKMQGFSRLERLVEELSKEERVKELKQEKKRQKRKNRRKNNCASESTKQEPEEKETSLDEGTCESVVSTCNACGSQDEEEEVSTGEVIVVNGSAPCNCSDRTILGSTPVEGSETGSRVGSDVRCTEGVCNHDEADNTHGHHSAENKEEDGVDSRVECRANSEGNTMCKIKKKKRKGKGLCNDRRQTSEDGNTSLTTSHPCQNKEACSSLCGSTFESISPQLPWAQHQKTLSHHVDNMCGQVDTNTKSLLELLEDSEVTSDEGGLTQDEIQAFVESNKSFYNNRDLYRQHLKDTFTKYCCETLSRVSHPIMLNDY